MNNNKMSRLDILCWIVLIAAFFLRFYQLAAAPYHPDEAIHAWFASRFREYHYDPVYHGPLLYHLLAITFGLLGPNDFSARFVPCVLGTLLVWMVLWPGRNYLGRRAAPVAGGMIAISPVMVVYSRHLLHDALVLVLTLGAVFCFQTTLENPPGSSRGRYARIGLAVLLTLFLATKANAFFIAAMLLAYWCFDVIRKCLRKSWPRFDILTTALCLMAALAVWCVLFRGDSFYALPKMIGYWSGQQKHPRLPGPHDYYFKLMLIYELPLVAVGVWGMFCALRRRTAFTNLLLWWTLTSIALYAIANEKVPWLLVHQMLPLYLLGGYGVAQMRLKLGSQRLLAGAAAVLALVFLGRHLVALCWGRPADAHEPMMYAQTTETYSRALFTAMQATSSQPQRDIWVGNAEHWPAAWYLRSNSPILGSSKVLIGTNAPPDPAAVRVVLCTPEDWRGMQNRGGFWGWRYRQVDRYVWSRPGWQSLTPQRFFRFWLHREYLGFEGILEEDSTSQSVIASAN